MDQKTIDAASDSLKVSARKQYRERLIESYVAAWFSVMSDGSLGFSNTYISGWHPLFFKPVSDKQEPLALVWNQCISKYPLSEQYDRALPWKKLYPAR